MYKTKNITKEALKALKIKNQDEIIALTGSELNPVKAWEVIKSASDNFNKSDTKAQEADVLLYNILHPEVKKQVKKETSKTNNKEVISIRERERARTLALLELELLIAS